MKQCDETVRHRVGLRALLVANIPLVLFNLIPAFPMDGGRVLRTLLASRMSHRKATRNAAWVGQGFAFVFGVIGLFGNPILLLIGVFVWIAARQETSAAQIRSALSGVPSPAVDSAAVWRRPKSESTPVVLSFEW